MFVCECVHGKQEIIQQFIKFGLIILQYVKIYKVDFMREEMTPKEYFEDYLDIVQEYSIRGAEHEPLRWKDSA